MVFGVSGEKGNGILRTYFERVQPDTRLSKNDRTGDSSLGVWVRSSQRRSDPNHEILETRVPSTSSGSIVTLLLMILSPYRPDTRLRCSLGWTSSSFHNPRTPPRGSSGFTSPAEVLGTFLEGRYALSSPRREVSSLFRLSKFS